MHATDISNSNDYCHDNFHNEDVAFHQRLRELQQLGRVGTEENDAIVFQAMQSISVTLCSFLNGH